MAILRASNSPVQRPAASWPDWTDADTWELGPDPSDADRAWWAEQNTDAHTDDPTPDEVYDAQAEEAAALDRLERGICL